jgi:hypothetical protein
MVTGFYPQTNEMPITIARRCPFHAHKFEKPIALDMNRIILPYYHHCGTVASCGQQ